MRIVRSRKIVLLSLLVISVASTLAVASYAGDVCNGGSYTSAGCEFHANTFYKTGGCQYSPGSSCYKCWYTCDGGGASRCGETQDGGRKACFNLRYQDALPLWWWN